MQLTLLAVVGVISIVVVAAFSGRLGLAAPLSLVVVGAVLGVPVVEIEPEWILATGWLFHLLLPGTGLPTAFALGAVIGHAHAQALVRHPGRASWARTGPFEGEHRVPGQAVLKQRMR